MDPFSQLAYPYAQRAVVELALLAIIAGALGPWVVLRGLAFFAHAVGTAAFPGLIGAEALSVAPQVGAAASSAVVSAGAGVIRPGRESGTRTALWLTGALAAGALVASRMTSGTAGLDSALFGSLLATSTGDLLLAGLVALAAVKACLIAGPRWLAEGMLGRNSGQWDALLMGLTALAALAQLTASGALLASTLLVLPAVAARPWVHRLPGWHCLTLAFALVVAFAGLLLALSLDIPPGGAIALCAGASVVGSYLAKTAVRKPPVRGVLTAGALFVILLAGCAPASRAPIAVATTPIVGDLVRSVAGQDVPVKTLIPAGADPHDWEPRPSDIAALADARVLFSSGGGMDDWAKSLLSRAGGKADAVDLGEGLPVLLKGDKGDSIDPHWFHDPANVAAAAGVIAAALSKAVPADAGQFAQRANRLASGARRLQAQASACVAKLTPKERVLVTDHDAFAYLANRLGLRVEGTVIPSQTTAATPSARQLDDLAAKVRRLGVRAIFPERSADPRLAKALAAQAGASASAQLDADTLRASPPQTWQAMWAGNVSRMVSALSGGRVACAIGASR